MIRIWNIWNERGAVLASAQVSDAIRQGVVQLATGLGMRRLILQGRGAPA